MPRTYSSIEKIRAELAWVNETPDPNKCGCRNARGNWTSPAPGDQDQVALKLKTRFLVGRIFCGRTLPRTNRHLASGGNAKRS
jgi:hypothetical protein